MEKTYKMLKILRLPSAAGVTIVGAAGFIIAACRGVVVVDGSV